MIAKNDYGALQARLQAILSETFENVQVQIGDDIHYRGTNLVVITPDFAGLLPEQRFHHLVRAIPSQVYDDHLRDGVVWFELAPGEAPRDYMSMPRSDDISAQADAIARRLFSIRFFHQIKDRLQKKPQSASTRDFTVSRAIMEEAGFSREEITTACLFFIRHGGFCDAQVLVDVVNELAGDHQEEKAAPPPGSPAQRTPPPRSKPVSRIPQQHI